MACACLPPTLPRSFGCPAALGALPTSSSCLYRDNSPCASAALCASSHCGSQAWYVSTGTPVGDSPAAAKARQRPARRRGNAG